MSLVCVLRVVTVFHHVYYLHLLTLNLTCCSHSTAWYLSTALHSLRLYYSLLFDTKANLSDTVTMLQFHIWIPYGLRICSESFYPINLFIPGSFSDSFLSPKYLHGRNLPGFLLSKNFFFFFLRRGYLWPYLFSALCICRFCVSLTDPLIPWQMFFFFFFFLIFW